MIMHWNHIEIFRNDYDKEGLFLWKACEHCVVWGKEDLKDVNYIILGFFHNFTLFFLLKKKIYVPLERGNYENVMYAYFLQLVWTLCIMHRCVISRKRKKREKKRPRKKMRARKKKNMIRKRAQEKKKKN